MKESANKNTRKWQPAIVLLSLLLAVLLVGCGSKTTNEDKEGQTGKDAPSEESPTKEDLDEGYGDVKHPKDELADITEEVKVVEVISGDTVVVEGENGEETVKLILVETPDPVLPDGSPDEMFGFKSIEFTNSLIDSPARLERGKDQKDEQGRTLGYIWLKEGADHVVFNRLLLAEGLARLVESEPDAKYLDEFKEAESQAKESKRNIWEIDGYVTEDGFDSSLVQ